MNALDNCRDKSKFISDAYSEDLENHLYSYFSLLPEITSHNFNDIFNDFISLITQVIDRHAPLKKLSRK